MNISKHFSLTGIILGFKDPYRNSHPDHELGSLVAALRTTFSINYHVQILVQIAQNGHANLTNKA